MPMLRSCTCLIGSTEIEQIFLVRSRCWSRKSTLRDLTFGALPAVISQRGIDMARRIAVWLLGGVAVVLLFVFIVSFFLDGIVRPHIERTMNASLKGYSATVPYAHLQLVGLTLTLRDLTILQKAHPRPPIAIFPTMRFQIEWKALMFGHV